MNSIKWEINLHSNSPYSPFFHVLTHERIILSSRAARIEPAIEFFQVHKGICESLAFLYSMWYVKLFFRQRSVIIRSAIYIGIIAIISTIQLLGGTSPKTVVASRAAVALRVDGILDEDEWKHSIPTAGFLQYDPEEGSPPTEATLVRIVYDNDALYVGVMCYDSQPSEIISQLTRRDRTTQADRFSVIIDSYHDETTAFLFSGSVSGVQSDGVLSQDGTLYDVQWDAVWDFNAQQVADGWSAEFRIPFSALRFTEQGDENVWGINFRRYIGRKKETDEWVMVPRKEAPVGSISSVSKMGHVSGLKDIHPPLHLEVLPYQSSNIKSIAQPSPFPRRSEFSGTTGLDLKFGLTQNFKLDLAVNPDFGQVEVDQSVLNLTVFETFYPEKRPFFLEGSQIFSFGTSFDNKQLRMFYSRRIGKQPFASSALAQGYQYVDEPQVTTILGAAKITGKTSDGLSLGIMSALTSEETAIPEDTLGNRLPAVVLEPQASYSTFRLKKDIDNHGSLGFIATGTFKDQRYPSLGTGVDWNMRPWEGKYALDGFLAGSQITPAPGEHRTGTAGRFGFGTLESDNWFGFTVYEFASRQFSINDIGYFSQPRDHGGFSEVSFIENAASEPIRRYALTWSYFYRWNWDGIVTQKQVEFEPKWEFRNFWMLTLNVIHALPAYDDEYRGIRGIYRKPESNLLSLTLQTDSRKPVILSGHAGYQHSEQGMTSWWSSSRLTLRPNSWIELAPGVTITSTRNETAWPLYFYTSNGNNLFSDRDIDQVDLSFRGTITFTRSISLQFFTQVLLAKGQYSSFKELLGANEFIPYSYDTSLGNPDFNEQILNANLVFRWEYLPASTIYLVWTQARYGDNGVYARSIGENISEAFKLPMDNVLLAKITYWWSL